jgi:CheY-like chemotaxis protein
MVDINMPDMNGVELSRRIRTQFTEPSRSVPILAITAYNDDAEDQRYREAGITDVVHKPVPFDQLKSTVERLARIAE